MAKSKNIQYPISLISIISIISVISFIFGNSSAACQQGYYQFTHIYTCKAGGPGWNQYGAVDACRFKPKVQVLDNWGWCNSEDGKGRWEADACKTDKSDPWTPFSGIIEIKP